MNVLILGSGGREHAVYVKLAQSSYIKKLLIAPGNAGVKDEFRLSDVNITDFPALLEKIKQHNIDFLFVGPEQPLALGIVDFFAAQLPSLIVFGPNQHAAQLEASKVFSFEFIKKSGLPVCRSEVAISFAQAKEKARSFSLPVVIKADGLAAGKGVFIEYNYDSVEKTLHAIFEDKIFGKSGEKVLLQDFMRGTEASLFVIMNGKEGIVLPTARDYKAAFDDNEGANTGGMGSICPGSALNEGHVDSISKTIVKAVAEHFQYRGVLYIGLMVHSPHADDYSIVEFNCRLGDPETQCVLPMLQTDLFPYLLWACGRDTREEILKVKVKDYYHIPYKSGYAVNVVVAAKDYPADYQKDIPLSLPQKLLPSTHVIHAGTRRDQNGNLLSSGGRILSVVGQGATLAEARSCVYKVLDEMRGQNDFTRLRFRSDIGKP